MTLRRTVEVTSVSGLAMNYALVPMLPKDVVAKSLLAQLAQIGQHPDSATCTDNLEGKLGNTVECTTVSGAQTQTYVLTVAAVQGGSITFQFVPKP